MIKMQDILDFLKEDITIAVSKGDTILGGKWKNKKIKVKSIGKDEYGMPTINGRKVVTFRLSKESLDEDAKFSSPLYHVTHTRLVGKIKKEGLRSLNPSNWVNKSSGERYGEGELFAFTDLTDAIRWAAKMDWDFNKETGSGKISILTIKPGNAQWKTDTADPLSQATNKGKWVKTFSQIPPQQITKVTPLTTPMIQALIKRDQT